MATRPIIVSTAQLTDTSATALVVGAPIGSSTAAANSGMKVATVSLESLAAPSITTNKLYNVSGALSWNGTTLATGSTISGTTGTIGKFTGVAAMGNSLLTESGSTVTMAGTLAATTFTGALATSNLTGNYVATVGSGTGITSSVTSGNAAATTVSLNNTAVTPASYGANCGVSLTVDQQGRLTAVASLTTLHPTAAPAAAGTIGFSGNTLVFQAGTSGHQFANSANNAVLVAISDTGNVSLGANITDAVGTPTVASGFGTSPSIVGKSYGFKVTHGTGTSMGGVVNFGATYANPPIVTVGSIITGDIWVTDVSTTQVQIGTSVELLDGYPVYVIVRGY